MAGRTFTLDDARALLPQVKALMHAAQLARQELIRLEPEIWPAVRKAVTNGGSKESAAALPAFQQIEAGIRSIIALGVHVKDVESGLVDFPARREGREIYLCWKYGEDDISFWHEVEAGFAGRQRIDDKIE
jgi:hypothetical protein